jgi:hypothetical protein
MLSLLALIREELEDREDASDAAVSERAEAMREVFKTVPTTLEGMRSKIDLDGSINELFSSCWRFADTGC